MNTLFRFAQSTTASTPNEALFALIFLGLGLFVVIATIILGIAYITNGFLLGKIFKKAGIQSWIAWVPVYNSLQAIEISRSRFGKSSLFDAVAFILPIIATIRLAKDKTTPPTV